MTRPIFDMTRTGKDQALGASYMVSIRTVTVSGTPAMTPLALIADRKHADLFCGAFDMEFPDATGAEALAITNSRRKVAR